MANGLPTASHLNKASSLLLCGVPLLSLIAFAGIDVYWIRDAYDAWRIIQVILLILLGVCAVFIHSRRSVFSVQTNKIFTLTIPILFGLVIASCWQAEHSARATADAALYGLLAISVWTQADLFRKKQNIAPHIAAWLAVLPLFMVVSLFTELAHAISDQTSYDWHQSFANMRMLDDALLPCIFLLWQRPAWLSKNYFRHSIFDKSITASIYLISTSYVLILWYDGARAVLISILVGLIFIALSRRDFWSKLCLPLATLLSASLLFLILKHLVVPDFSANPILRTGSSGRDDLWIKTFQLWQENPFFGIGGNNFVTSDPWLLNAHPHNMPLQLLCEWGVAGVLAFLLLAPLAILFFRHRQILPAFALGAVVAVAIDALFSGVLDYPLSQMLGVWSLAWLISLLPTAHPLNSIGSIDNNPLAIVTSDKSVKSLHLILKVIALTAILALLFVHGKDIICRNCMSTDEENAPRFWQYGRALHLVPMGSEVINHTEDALLKNR